VRTVSRNHSTNTAAAARRALSAFFAWAISDGLLGNGANPVDGSHRPADPEPRDHVLTDVELVKVWRASGDDDYGRIVRLLTLLGSRRQEVGGMRWTELDFNRGEWHLPRERSKNKREQTIALPQEALGILSSTPRDDGDCLFGFRAAGFSSWTDGKKALDGRLVDTVRPWRLHDIRRTVATGMADLGIEPHVIEACLNHYSGHRRGIAGIYNRSRYERATASAFARWADHVMALVEGRDNKVVPLRA
jgi:integrase